MKTYKVIASVLQRIIWLPTRVALKFFCNFEVKGIKNIEIKKNAIFAANHWSEIDPILVAASFPFFSKHLPLFYTCLERRFYQNKGPIKKIIYGGVFFKIWGAHPVYIGLKNYEQSLKNHINILCNEGSICIFPEGKKNAENKPIKVKGGVSFLVHKTQFPVIPVSISGAQFMTWRDFFSRKRKIKIVFGKPLYAKNIFKEQIVLHEHQDDYKTAANLIMDKIKRLH